MTAFTLGEATAFECEACGYVGVEADHTGEPKRIETWEEAMRRFESE
ncbi:hypothetical protein [Halorubrum sp. CBA1125]|nr:hypothetical protein [Halorubrum sp. CBA1125]